MGFPAALFATPEAVVDQWRAAIRNVSIASFRHRGLQALYEGTTTRRVAAEHVTKLLDILAVLDRSRVPEDMRLPGFRLHRLTGKRRGQWAVSVSGNWRVTFRFVEGDAVEVDYVEYH